jgi:hypothetical protein
MPTEKAQKIRYLSIQDLYNCNILNKTDALVCGVAQKNCVMPHKKLFDAFWEVGNTPSDSGSLFVEDLKKYLFRK